MGTENLLRLCLRAWGVMSLLALPFVFVPRSWMNRIHAGLLGMGQLPAEPIVGYLARSLSAFYAILGGMMLLMASDLERYRPAIGYLLITSAVFGVVILIADICEGLPRVWIAVEGPSIVLVSSFLLLLWWRLGRAG